MPASVVIRSVALGLLALLGCAPAYSRAAPTAAAPGACARVHELWKAQLRTLYANRGSVPVDAWVEQVYRPNAAFWNGYLGDESAFRQWAAKFALGDDPRRSVPLKRDIAADIRKVTARASAFAGRPRPCSDWYVLFGPGWTNMGGVGKGQMVVDFMGMPKADPLTDFDIYLPHEVNHLLWTAARPDAGLGPLLERIVSEGFATYFAAIYDPVTPARSLGYTPGQFRWAVAHERELWNTARPLLASEDSKVIEPYMAASSHLTPAAPGKIGYFLGFRIVQAYVARHGSGSWKELYKMTAKQILDASGYDPK